MSAPSVYGHQPDLAGATLEGLICEAFVHHGDIQSEANVVFIRVRGEWWRLSIDHGTVHWKEQLVDPEPWAVPNEGWSYPHANVGGSEGLVGQVILGIHTSGEWPEARVELHLGNGLCFAFFGAGDATMYSVS